MVLERPPTTEEWISVASGRLRWRPVGEHLVARDYRIRLLGPDRWETTYRGRLLGIYTRRSKALALAEHHFREVQRVQQITRWGLSAGVALLGATVAAQWISTPQGFLLFAVAVGMFLGSTARCLAAINRSLLDPYRTRESWEPPDWWNPHWSR